MTLSTHVLDTAHGCPAAGVRIALRRGGELLFDGVSDDDGRCPALSHLTIEAGRYSLRFEVADYFRARGVALPEPAFLDEIEIAFGLAEPAGHYHVPLLVSPFSYSTYRGS